MTATTNEDTTYEQPPTVGREGDDPEQVETPTVAEATDEDLGTILPEPTTLTIDGIPAQVRRLKSREFLTLMRVITAGLGSGIRDIRLDVNDAEALQSDMMAILFIAVPNSIEDFGQFLSMIVEPREANNKDQANRLDRIMANPEPDVLIDVLGIMVLQEKDDMVALAGKARAWMSQVQKTVNRPKTP